MIDTHTVPGLESLILDLDRATDVEDVEELCRRVKDVLERHTRASSISLPPEIRRPEADSYARRLLHLDPDERYSVLAMIWGPAQGTPLHDHAGTWCVEGVYEGEIDVQQYDLVEESDERFRFRPEETVRAAPGDAGSLIPPFEYHTIQNPRDDRIAVTLHVYGGEMTECTVFRPEGDGWFRRERRELAYSAKGVASS